jgi:arylsulfatase B
MALNHRQLYVERPRQRRRLATFFGKPQWRAYRREWRNWYLHIVGENSRRRNGADQRTSSTYATTDTTNDALAWINARGSNPWFAWVAYNAPHSPFHKPPSDLHTYDTEVSGWNTLPIGANQRTHFNAAIEALDTEIGRLLSSMTPTVLANTWVIFVGDNGSPPQVVQDPFGSTHAKNTLYEGGVRVPLLISGPGVVSPDRESSDLVHAVDLYSTILEMAGIDVAATQPAVKPIDSESLMPQLFNQPVAARGILSESFGSTLTDDVSGTTARLHLLPSDPD